MQMLCKNVLMSEEFEGPHDHYTLEKGFLHVNYALNRFKGTNLKMHMKAHAG